MRAIFRMRMIVYSTSPIIPDMRDENQHHCWNQQPNLVLQEELFGDQKGTTDIKKEQRLKAVVVPTETVPERIRANGN